jgi:hypothetical protein
MGVGVDECAAAARSRGFPVFALQGYGQCFFGSMADVARLQVSQKLSDDLCANLPCPASAATCPSYINEVYILIGMHCSIELCSCQRYLIVAILLASLVLEIVQGFVVPGINVTGKRNMAYNISGFFHRSVQVHCLSLD